MKEYIIISRNSQQFYDIIDLITAISIRIANPEIFFAFAGGGREENNTFAFLLEML